MYVRKVSTALAVVAASAALAAWEEVPLPPKEDTFIGWMDFARPDLGFACTSDPLDPRPFLKYRDGRWTAGSFVFNALAGDGCFLPNGYGWVVGASTRIYPCIYTLRLQAGSSQLEEVPNPYSSPPGAEGSMPRVSFGAEEDGWLLLSSRDELLRYEDGYWRSVGNPLPTALGYARDICFPTANEGWVCGSNGFAHYKDGKWEFVPGPAVDELDFTARDDGWAVSRNGANVYHYNGSSWSVSYSAPGYEVSYVSFCDRGNGWATYWYNSEKGTILVKYDNGNWHRVILPNKYGCGTPCVLSAELAWFHGYSSAAKPQLTTWRWTTAPNVRPASFGRIKAMFATEEEDDEEGINIPASVNGAGGR
jgi:hypothetical protein